MNQILTSLRKEYEELEKHVVELATKFNDTVEAAQPPSEEISNEKHQSTDVPAKRKTRRKRGTELTLDD